VSPTPKESLTPNLITRFRDLITHFPQARRILSLPEAEYSITLSPDTLLLLSRHISSSFSGQEQIEPSLALPCQNSDEDPSRWITDKQIKFPSDWPHTGFGFQLSWLKQEGGYQKIFDFLTNIDLSAPSRELHSYRQLALETASLLSDANINQSFDHVYDQATLYLCALTKPSRRQSYDSLEISFSSTGIVTVHKGLYNTGKDTFSNRHYLFDRIFQTDDSPEKITKWLNGQINDHAEVSRNLKKLIPPISSDQS